MTDITEIGKKPLAKQQRRVLDYIREHRGCTTKDIMLGTGIQCPSGRISELRAAGINIISIGQVRYISIGQVRYAGSKAFEKYVVTPAQQLPLAA